jgi:hypothetical protein
VGVDLSGGWFDAGDLVKFGLPMAYSASILGWGYLEYEANYKKVNLDGYLKDNMRFVLDYFLNAYQIKSTLKEDIFYYQVGDGDLDHAKWGVSEKLSVARPAFACTSSAPCSEVSADTASALAIGYLIFKEDDPTYANRLLESAKRLYSFSKTYMGNSGYIKANSFYRSYSGYYDELSFSALWLYKATNDSAFLTEAKEYLSKSGDGTYWAMNWDNVSNASWLLLAKLGDSEAQNRIETHLNYWCDSVTTTSGGLRFLDGWGSLRYSANSAFLAFVYADWVSDEAKRGKYIDFAKSQIDYILGDNPRNASYMVGFGQNYPINPHHARAHDSQTNTINNPTNNTHLLEGAMVGGVASANDFDYVDDRGDYVRNEVATDYNAGLSGALARLIDEASSSSAQSSSSAVQSSSSVSSVASSQSSSSSVASSVSSNSSSSALISQSGNVVRTISSDWGAGFCENVKLYSDAQTPSPWEVSLDIAGDVYTVWNAKMDNGSFSNKPTDAWNYVSQSSPARFGFCAYRSASSLELSDSLIVSEKTTSTWNSGYCKDIRLRSNSYALQSWQVSLEVEGLVYTHWNSKIIRQEGDSVTFGMQSTDMWNQMSATKEAQFGFCVEKKNYFKAVPIYIN